MSFKLMARALEVKTGSAISKLILIKMCDNANDEGVCWPSQETIANHCEVTRETVSRNIKKLIEQGYLTVIKTDRKKGNTYKINVTLDHIRCDAESHGCVTQNHANLSEESIRNQENTKRIREEVILHYNKTNCKNLDPKSMAYKIINKRINEGYTLEDFKTVIDKFKKRWGNCPKMSPYNVPTTLFNSKFDERLNSPDVKETAKVMLCGFMQDLEVVEYSELDDKPVGYYAVRGFNAPEWAKPKRISDDLVVGEVDKWGAGIPDIGEFE